MLLRGLGLFAADLPLEAAGGPADTQTILVPTQTVVFGGGGRRGGSLGGLDDVRTYGHKAERAAALIYAHFKKEFGGSNQQNGRSLFNGFKNQSI